MDDIKHHTFRGSRSILLLNNLDKKQVNETGWRQFIVQNRNVRYTFVVTFKDAMMITLSAATAICVDMPKQESLIILSWPK